MSVFSTSTSVISEQPSTSREQEYIFEGTRRPIPVVSTIDWESSLSSTISPLHGLDFLTDVSQILIQQTVELSDLISNIASENRYTVRMPRGDTIFYATESSTPFQRTCFGSGRAFTIRLFDPTQQEAILFQRRLACGSCCSIFCYLQELDVWVPHGDYVGKIKQEFNSTRPSFLVVKEDGVALYRIEGDESVFGCVFGKNHNFQIYSPDGATQIGSIIHQWDHIQSDYNLHIQLPGSERNNRNKSLLIGAAFLLEYMYFENTRRKPGFKCIC